MKKLLGTGSLILGLVLSLGFVAAPVQAAALSSTQVSAIVSLLQSFGADSGTIANVQAALGGQNTGSSSSCLTLSENLYAGETDATTNGEVTELQQFLGVSPTGYFGPLTLQAVENWQSSHGIVSSGTPDTTGYGFVGPQTRAAMACSGSTQNAAFSASPTSGAAPLAVTFTGPQSVAGDTVDFGDGTLGTMSPTACPQASSSCGSNSMASHTYTAAGTYTARLFTSVGFATTNTITITVTNGSQTGAPTITSISPTSAAAGSTVSVFGTNFDQYTFVALDGSYGQAITPSLVSPTELTFVIPTNTAAGTHTVQVSEKAGSFPLSNAVYLTVTSGCTSNCPVSFTASPTYGAAPLGVQFTSNTPGTVNFGDGTTGTLVPNPMPMYVCGSGTNCVNPTPTYSITHTYTTANTYTAQLSNTSGSVVGTATITVTNGSTQGGVSFTASPTSGTAPLSVSFNATGFSQNASYTINFGDGTSASMNQGGCVGVSSVVGGSGGIQCSYSASHTYTAAGTYTAQLLSQINCPCTSGACSCPASGVSLATATITVTGTSQGAVSISSISPASGRVGTAIIITGSGFTSTGNTVRFASGGSQNISSSNGTQIAYVIPGIVTPCSVAQAGMACPDIAQAITPGTYSVFIINANGTSNTLSFTVTN
jgi:PKD repeat protein